MLEIIVSGISLDLPKDIQIAITVENPLMLEDRIPAPYSLNFDLPPTPKNKHAFGYPDRLGGYGVFNNLSKKEKPCIIRFQGINILTGHVIFLQFLTNIKLQFIGVDYNEFLRAPMNTLDLGRKYFAGDFDDVDFRDSNNFAWNYARWAEELASGSRTDMIAAPIAMVSENMPFSRFMEEYSKYQQPEPWTDNWLFKSKMPFEAQDMEYINQYNPYNGSFILEPEENLEQGRRVYRSHASIFPQFRVGYLFDVIFSSILLNNPFTDGYLYNLVMPTYYFSTWKQRLNEDVSTDYNAKNNFPPMVSNPRPSPANPYPDVPFVELSDFLPNVASSDFVKTILKLFCMTMAPSNGKLVIKSSSQIIAGLPQKDWSDKVSSEIDVKFELGKQYFYGYSSGKRENVAISDAVHKTSIKEMMETPYTVDDQGYYEQKFLIQNQVFFRTVQKKDDVKFPLMRVTEYQDSYSILDNGFNSFKEKGENSVFDMTSSAIPLPQYPGIFFRKIDNYFEEDDVHSSQMKRWVVAGFNGIDRNVRPSEIYLAFNRGHQLVNGETDKYYPSIGSNLEAGTSGPTVLEWDGQYGLFNTYHKRYAEWIAKEKVTLNLNVRLNPVELKNLDILEKIHIRGRNFFIKKMQYTIGLNSISLINIDFLEA
ncbi:hypothetical protein [Sphingobacterium daejeonense]|uniref:hypothetical protein n=1 Tax=Sphingobacterium daejeonense TaxID=371142 RepID=UPI0010C2DA97|nr:hypothetical protein [Sphingobacterium daejeonense]VTQ01666.1 Uncharacterised protein [Sphingobacterium daejeonense]